MAFKEMIQQLVRDGLIDKDHNLTQKGHEYVEQVKRKYRAELSKNRASSPKGERRERRVDQDEPEEVC